MKNISYENKILILILFFMFTAVGLVTYFITPSRQDIVLSNALYLKPYDHPNSIGMLLNRMFPNENTIFWNFSKKYYPDSFSYFFLLSYGIPKEYELDSPPLKTIPNQLTEFVLKYKTVCTLYDVKDQQWKWDNENFSGSFSFITPYGLRGRCLFEGKNSKIEKMVIARRDSNKLKDGYAVFGCRYGRNVLLDEPGNCAINLPESTVGEYITYEKFDSLNIIISLDKRGVMSILGMPISKKIMEKAFKAGKDKDPGIKPTIFLWIDKQSPERCSITLIKFLRQYNLEIYQVFFNEKEGYPIAKKLKV